MDAGVARVWMGRYDPNPKTNREEWRLLRDAGVELRDFDADLRSELVAVNAVFLDGFRLCLRHGWFALLRARPTGTSSPRPATPGSHARSPAPASATAWTCPSRSRAVALAGAASGLRDLLETWERGPERRRAPVSRGPLLLLLDLCELF